jgi:serine protease Do
MSARVCSPAHIGLRTITALAVSAGLACGQIDGNRTADAADAQPSVSETPGPATALRAATPPAQQVATAQQGAQIDTSKRTAIVQASERVAPAVVHVATARSAPRPRSAWESLFYNPRPTTGFGSGFLIDPSGTILTNDHVVRGAERILVTLPDGRDFEARVVGSDATTDVAVLQIDGAGLPVAPLGTTRGLVIGEWAIAIGNPFGYLFSNPEPTVTAGVISALGRHLIQSSEERGFYVGMVQTDASINPGNSGGPLVNALGEVIGINSSIFSRSGGSEGLGFAIPIDRALRVADDLIEYGEVRRAWLGFEVEAVEGDIWGRTHGVGVTRVVGESPAAAAGLRAGDRLLMANGRGLSNPLDFEAVMLDLRPGDELEIAVEGQSPVRMRAESVPSLRAERVRVFEDLELVTLTAAIRQEQGVASEAGALIVSITPDLGRQLDLRAGDVLLRINDIQITSAEDAARALRSLRRRVRIYFERNQGLNVRDFVVR